MTDNLLHHLRPTTLARLAAEIVISHTDNPGPRADYRFDFNTEAAGAAYSELLNALVANTGEDDAFDLLDQALAAEWDAYNDQLFNN